MENKDKHLLLADICARLPYGVKAQYITGDHNRIDCGIDMVSIASECVGIFEIGTTKVVWRGIEYIKPYLRPMSSMTEEERLELSRLTNDKFKFYLYTRNPEIICYEKYNYLEGLKVLDWLISHHFDFRGLIEKGLALEAPEGMYQYKTE